MAGATRPVAGGAYSSPRSEPGGQNTPRAGRVVASYGTYISALGLFAQQVEQGDIFDEAAAGVVTAGGSGVEDYRFDESGITTVTASGSGTESAISTDTGSGTIAASGTSTESSTATDSGSGIATTSGISAESYDTIDARSGTTTASGSSVESYSFIDSQTGVVTADGTSVESYGFIYTDTASGTATASGVSTESYSHDESASGTLTASGTGVEKRVYGDDATYYDNVIDVDNPVSHWKLGDPSTAVDRKGVLNLPAISGPIGTTAGVIANNANDRANSFAGGISRFDANPAIDRGLPYDTDTWSLEAWATCSSYATDGYVIYRGSTADQSLFAGTSGRWVLESKAVGGTVSQAFPAPSTLVLGQAYHLVGTYDGTNLILYINGVEAARAAMASQRHDTQFAPNISSSRGGLGFNGTTDEVAWYPTALSAARVLAHYQAGTVDAGIVPPTVTASGTGTESSVNNDTGSGTVTASGSGTEVYSAPIVYTDSRTATVTATGTGFQTYTPYDAVLDEDQPISHYKLGGTTQAVDRMGVMNLPASNGPITTAGLVANNSNDSSNSFVRASSQRFVKSAVANQGLPYEKATWSVEAWMQLSSNTGVTMGIVGRGGNQALRVDSSRIPSVRATRPDLGGTTANGNSALVVGQRYHLVGTYDGTRLSLFVNGVEQNAHQAEAALAALPNEAPAIGDQGDQRVYFEGTIDEVAWYGTALTPARVLAHYQAGVATAYDAVIDADTPVSHWKMGWSTTKAVDRARRKLNLDAQNPPIAISDKGVVYQGDNDRANTFVTGSSQQLSRSSFSGSDGTLYDTANLSVEAWIKPTATRLGFGDSPGIINRQFSEVVLQLFSAKPRFSFNDTAVVSKIASSPTSLVANAAYHLVGTYDGANLILYVNGAEMARLASATGIRSDPTNYPQIGYAGGDYWDGDIDEVAWYDTALSPARVQAHFLAGLAGYGTVSGTSTDAAVYTDSGSGTATATGTGSESYSVSDSGLGTATVSGTGVELCVASDSGYVTVVVSGSSVESNYISQILRPDGDIAVAGWVTAPLYSKLSDDSDATVVTGVLV